MKIGFGIEDVFEVIVICLFVFLEGDEDVFLKVMLVDSWYDVYFGVIVFVCIIDGILKKG